MPRLGGIRTLRPTALALAFVIALCVPAAAVPMPGLPAQGDPDVPAASEPIAVVTVLENEVWSYTAGFHGRDIIVPAGWDRVVLEFTQKPLGDPWDRTFAASIAGVEVLRGTTPRTTMTVEKDVTRYASLLPEGGLVRVEGYTDTYVAAMSVTLKLRFYEDATAALVAPPVDEIVNVQRFAGLCTGGSVTRTVDFGYQRGSATIELFLSGHGSEEFWFRNAGGPRTVLVHVDDVEVGRAVLMPYTYAFVGFAGGPGGTMNAQNEQLHKAMWWTGQQALDKAGVHVNAGEIPPYRVPVHSEDLGLLAGPRDVRVSIESATGTSGSCVWTTSAAFLLD